jgi:hypothetical protein
VGKNVRKKNNGRIGAQAKREKNKRRMDAYYFICLFISIFLERRRAWGRRSHFPTSFKRRRRVTLERKGDSVVEWKYIFQFYRQSFGIGGRWELNLSPHQFPNIVRASRWRTRRW